MGTAGYARLKAQKEQASMIVAEPVMNQAAAESESQPESAAEPEPEPAEAKPAPVAGLSLLEQAAKPNAKNDSSNSNRSRRLPLNRLLRQNGSNADRDEG